MSKITSYVLFLLCVARDQVSLWKGGTIVYATLLDAGQCLCSERTMYRVLAAHQGVRERRDQLRHPAYAAPDLLARRPKRAAELGHHQPRQGDLWGVSAPGRPTVVNPPSSRQRPRDHSSR